MAKLMKRRQPIEHVVAHDVLSVLGCVARHIRLEVCYKSRIAVRNLIEQEPYSHAAIQKVKSHPWVPKQISVRGFVYDVKTGRLKEVAQAQAASSWSA